MSSHRQAARHEPAAERDQQRGEDVVAVLYGFLLEGKFDYYQAGIARGKGGPLVSPGTTAIAMLMIHFSVPAHDRGTGPRERVDVIAIGIGTRSATASPTAAMSAPMLMVLATTSRHGMTPPAGWHE